MFNRVLRPRYHRSLAAGHKEDSGVVIERSGLGGMGRASQLSFQRLQC